MAHVASTYMEGHQMAVETKILFTRHEDHEKQVLLPEARERAIRRGNALREKGYAIDVVVSSPLPRAIATSIAMLEGFGSADIPFALEPRLGDFKTDRRARPEDLKNLKATAIEKYGDAEDANLARAFLDEQDLHDLLFARAKEGAEALCEIAKQNTGRTVLVTSHGVARMEITLRYLLGIRGKDVLDIVPNLIDRGEVVELTFKVMEFTEGFSVELDARMTESKRLRLL